MQNWQPFNLANRVKIDHMRISRRCNNDDTVFLVTMFNKGWAAIHWRFIDTFIFPYGVEMNCRFHLAVIATLCCVM